MCIPLVSVIMPTYNHEKYIAQAIESVLLQECDFKYQLIIGEDRSIDNTRAICQEFAIKHPGQIVLLPATANLGLVLNYKQLFEASSTKYVAILEGDDYWIDKDKLQMQVNIMEKDSSIGLVHTRSSSLYEDGDIKLNTHLRNSSKIGIDLFEEIICGKYTISPLTVCFRQAIFTQFVNYEFCISNKLKTIDFFLWLEMSMHTKFFFIDKVTGHYRILSSSISNSNNYEKFKGWHEKAILTLDYYKLKYPISKPIEKKIYNVISSEAVKMGLENHEYNFVKTNAKNIAVVDIKSFFNFFIGRFSFLHFLYPTYSKILNLSSKFKQLVINN